MSITVCRHGLYQGVHLDNTLGVLDLGDARLRTDGEDNQKTEAAN